MSHYSAPLQEMEFLLNHVVDARGFNNIAAFDEYDAELVSAVLEEAAKFSAKVLWPLNQSGDIEGCQFHQGLVTTPKGWVDAYRQFCENGWLSLALPVAHGGQGLPHYIAAPVHEMWLSANMSFVMFQTLTQGAVSILCRINDPSLNRRYLQKLVSGQWATCMSLTESTAGSDLGSISTRATPTSEGQYLIKGQKIFISYAEHDLAENIIHLVLARTPDAVEGAKGLSLFIVPKYQVAENGQLGPLNDLRCISIEHKLGLHGSPTCSVSYGDADGCLGELVGEEQCGLETMFILMNEARLSTGQQGVAIGEMAYQRALEYSLERIQGRDALTGQRNVAIASHPDVKRMLMGMRAQVLTLRALSYQISAQLDMAAIDSPERDAQLRFVALMTPVFKAFATQSGNDMANTSVQIFGGMGVIEETGVAQLLRDVRVTTIYEGSSGIQANDLVFRKVVSDQGLALRELIAQIEQDFARYSALQCASTETTALRRMIDTLGESCDYIVAKSPANREALLCGAVSFLEQLGISCCSWMMMRCLIVSEQLKEQGIDTEYYKIIRALSHFYFAHFTPKALSSFNIFMNAKKGILDYNVN